MSVKIIRAGAEAEKNTRNAMRRLMRKWRQ